MLWKGTGRMVIWPLWLMNQYQGLGIGTYLYQMLIRIAKERGISGFTADVLASNKSMMKVFEKSGLPVKAHLESGAYELTIPFDAQPSSSGGGVKYEHGKR